MHPTIISQHRHQQPTSLQPQRRYPSHSQTAPVSNTHTCLLDLLQLPIAARQAHIIPKLVLHSLISVPMLCNAGCRVHFTKNECIITHNNTTITPPPTFFYIQSHSPRPPRQNWHTSKPFMLYKTSSTRIHLQGCMTTILLHYNPLFHLRGWTPAVLRRLLARAHNQLRGCGPYIKSRPAPTHRTPCSPTSHPPRGQYTNNKQQ